MNPVLDVIASPTLPTPLLGAAGGATPIVTGIAVAWLLAAALILYKRPLGVLVAGLEGLAVSLYLGMQHHAAAGTSFCSVSEVFDCDAVNRSQYSELFGIPIALIGAAFYAGFAALGLMQLRKPEAHPFAGHLVLTGGALSVLYSAFLAWASHQLGSWCLLCISLYGINAILLMAGLLATRAPDASDTGIGAGVVALLKGGPDNASLTTVATAAAVVLLGSVLIYRNGGEGPATADTKAVVDPAKFIVGEVPLTLDGTEPMLGSASAAYTLVEFADFECPYCGMVAPELHTLTKENQDLKLLFKHYPISSQCNEQVEKTGHENACGAAAAAECARQQGKFWELDALMFKNQGFLDSENVLFMAGQVGLDKDAFTLCMQDSRTLDAVKADVAHAAQAGVQGTPSFFLYGLDGDRWARIEATPADIGTLLGAHRGGARFTF